MANTATITDTAGVPVAEVVTERKRWALALQAKEKAVALKGAILSGSKKAIDKAREAAEFIRSTSAYDWVRRIFTRALWMLRGAKEILGTTGILAAVLAVVTSRKGQQALAWLGGKLTNAALSAAGYTIEGITKVLSWIPKVGKRISERFHAGAMNLSAKVIGWSMRENKGRFSRHLRHDAPAGYGLNVGATTFVGVTVGMEVAKLLPAPWNVAAYVVTAAGTALYGYRKNCHHGLRVLWNKAVEITRNWVLGSDVAAADQVLADVQAVPTVADDLHTMADKVVDAPAGPEIKTVIHNPNGSQLAGRAAHVVADVEVDMAVEKHQADNKAAGESAQRIKAAEIYEAQAGGVALVTDTDAIAQVTADFFDEDKKYTSREQLVNDLKGRVYPIFKHHLNSKLTSKAARGFAMLMADNFGEGDGLYAEPGTSTALRERIAVEALAFIDDPLRNRKQTVSA